jgi:cell division transport system permease protein
VIVDRIFLRGPESRLLPAEGLHGPTVAVMAIMTFVMIVVAATGLAVANSAGLVVSGTESRFVIEIPAASASDLPRATAAARGVPGVRGVTAVPQSEMRRTLERWLGETANSPDLPIPAMATVELDPTATPAQVEKAVRAQVPGATFSAESADLKPLLRSLRATEWLALSLVFLMAAATAAAIVLAARGALDTHRYTVEIMHGIGATDRQVTRLFERKIAIDAIAGALLASIGAAIVLVTIGGGVAAVASDLAWTAPLDASDFAILALVPVLAVVLAVAVAHRTLLGALRANL